MNRCFLTIQSVALLTAAAAAQCSLQVNASTTVLGNAASIQATATMPNGDLIVGGEFTAIGGTAANNIARRSGGSWQALGAGVGGRVNAVAVLPNGDLVAGGFFTTAGGAAAARIARWDGANWSPLGTGMSGSQFVFYLGVWSLLVRPNGDLVAGGHFLDAGGTAVANIATWNGTAWSALAGGIPGGVHPTSPPPLVESLANLANGDLVATGGLFSVQRWDGSTWSAMNSGMSPTTFSGFGPKKLLVSSSGTLFACGREQPSTLSPVQPFVSQWNGTSWTTFGVWLPTTGSAEALAELPTGDIVVGLGSSGQLLKSNGAAWSLIANQRAVALSMQSDRLIIAAGFNDPNVTTGALAELVSNCPAGATNVGTPCAGSIGTHTLTATSLPWLGSTFRAVTSAVPATAIALAVSSLSPTTLPLSVVTPVAGAGCEGLVFPDLTELLLSNGNQVTSQIALPLLPAFVGTTIHHYVAVVEFGAGGAPIGFTSTGRLQLTLGIY